MKAIRKMGAGDGDIFLLMYSIKKKTPPTEHLQYQFYIKQKLWPSTRHLHWHREVTKDVTLNKVRGTDDLNWVWTAV